MPCVVRQAHSPTCWQVTLILPLTTEATQSHKLSLRVILNTAARVGLYPVIQITVTIAKDAELHTPQGHHISPNGPRAVTHPRSPIFLLTLKNKGLTISLREATPSMLPCISVSAMRPVKSRTISHHPTVVRFHLSARPGGV